MKRKKKLPGPPRPYIHCSSSPSSLPSPPATLGPLPPASRTTLRWPPNTFPHRALRQLCLTDRLLTTDTRHTAAGDQLSGNLAIAGSGAPRLHRVALGEEQVHFAAASDGYRGGWSDGVFGVNAAEAFSDGATEGEGRLVLEGLGREEDKGVVAEEEEVPVQLFDGRDRRISDMRSYRAEIDVPPYQFLVSASLLWNLAVGEKQKSYYYSDNDN